MTAGSLSDCAVGAAGGGFDVSSAIVVDLANWELEIRRLTNCCRQGAQTAKAVSWRISALRFRRDEAVDQYFVQNGV